MSVSKHNTNTKTVVNQRRQQRWRWPGRARLPMFIGSASGSASNRKGASVWISYVLLTALLVSLGVLVLNWSKTSTQETVDELLARGDALTICQSAGIDVRDLCQDAQTLNMAVFNSNDIAVEGIWVSMFDIYNLPQVSSRNRTIAPQKSREMDVVKQGIIKQVEILPLVESGGKLIKCQSRKVSFETVPVCA